jgi:non-heme chloroperoxidase
VVFVHGLWLLPNSWDRWREVFEAAGYVTLAAGWPDDPDTVEAAKEHPEVFAHKSVGQIADHYDEVISALERKPAVLGHSFECHCSKPRRPTSTPGPRPWSTPRTPIADPS